MINEVLAYDCDGNELYEFDIVRIPFYNYIDFDDEIECNPRQYCLVKDENKNIFLISVYDNWNKNAINRYEKRDLNMEVPISILPISESINFEKAYDCNNEWIRYEFDKSELKKKIKI